MIVSRWMFLRMGNVSDKSCRENQNTHFVFSKLFSRKYCRLWDTMEKYGTVGQVTDGNTRHARCMLDTKRYRHALRVYKTYCFLSKAAVVTWTRLNVTFICILLLSVLFICTLLSVLFLPNFTQKKDLHQSFLLYSFSPLTFKSLLVTWCTNSLTF